MRNINHAKVWPEKQKKNIQAIKLKPKTQKHFRVKKSKIIEIENIEEDEFKTFDDKQEKNEVLEEPLEISEQLKKA